MFLQRKHSVFNFRNVQLYTDLRSHRDKKPCLEQVKFSLGKKPCYNAEMLP